MEDNIMFYSYTRVLYTNTNILLYTCSSCTYYNMPKYNNTFKLKHVVA